MSTTAKPIAADHAPGSLQRVLFGLAGTMTLLSVGLAVLVSPWFLLIAAGVAVNQWAFALVGACPASIVLTRVAGLRGCER